MTWGVGRVTGVYDKYSCCAKRFSECIMPCDGGATDPALDVGLMLKDCYEPPKG